MNESLMYGSEDEYKAVTLMLSSTSDLKKVKAQGETDLWLKNGNEESSKSA